MSKVAQKRNTALLCLLAGILVSPVPGNSTPTVSELDSAAALYQLGVMRMNGEGAEQDIVQGRYWIHLAARHGYPLAQYNLGVMYFDGIGGVYSRQCAQWWLNKAADQNDPEVRQMAGQALQSIIPEIAQLPKIYRPVTARDCDRLPEWPRPASAADIASLPEDNIDTGKVMVVAETQVSAQTAEAEERNGESAESAVGKEVAKEVITEINTGAGVSEIVTEGTTEQKNRTDKTADTASSGDENEPTQTTVAEERNGESAESAVGTEVAKEVITEINTGAGVSEIVTEGTTEQKNRTDKTADTASSGDENEPTQTTVAEERNGESAESAVGTEVAKEVITEINTGAGVSEIVTEGTTEQKNRTDKAADIVSSGDGNETADMVPVHKNRAPQTEGTYIGPTPVPEEGTDTGGAKAAEIPEPVLSGDDGNNKGIVSADIQMTTLPADGEPGVGSVKDNPGKQVSGAPSVSGRAEKSTDAESGKPKTLKRREIRPAPVLNLGGSPATAQGKHYTLQLSGGTTQDELYRTAQRHKMTNYVVYETERYGQRWYVLVSGEYATLTEANQALKALPAELRRNGPWVRSLRLVQNEMRKSGGM